ncbi:fructan beta-fructosidase [Paenibacillus sp. V4I3]|uniref:GH32 C-terminal domain-containing protein n=1 Tax=unclassified Paenibacillus TaxID=185978 RepID=UPI00277F5E57|nr:MULTISPECIES: GH32 C-terminal domain-containing protein [unclassified Paenibacillus]MDQ0878662.1 fructan beta-fructosidase [Paenibacillus sp. V4I3]MDQ0885481.1 fructan beta-fructosidase [Paenibacillus sp. V4I9]
MRKKLGLWAVGTAAVVLLGLGVAVLVKEDGRSSDSAENSAFTYASDPNYYTEKFRPQYHLSPESGNMSDPNGMVYFEGEYHQFYQSKGQWGHAVSKDLIHWDHLPVALARDSLGEIWSGSAVVDSKDTSGFFGGKAGLVAIFTHFKGGVQSQSIAYSADKGRTWTKYEGNPVIPNQGLKDFRDPKVIWHAPTHSWVMVVSVDNHVRFYASPDLKSWKMTSEFGSDQGSHAAVWECPDLFELPVEGSKAKKWVLAVSIGSNNTTKGSTAQYFIGTFDGLTFKNDNKPSDVLWTDYGKDFYAAVSYSDIPAKDGRRIWLGWMSNWRYAFAMPTSSWRGNMSIPRELRLRNIPDQGLRLIQEPIKELQTLRGKEVIVSKQALSAGNNPFDVIKGTSYEMVTELSVQPNAKLAFKLRKGSNQETGVSYDAKTEQLTVDRTHSGITSFEKGFAEKVSAPLKLKEGKLKLRFFVDESSLEVFGHDGEAVVSSLIFPDPTSNRLELTALEGSVTLESAHFYPIQTIWRDEDVNAVKPQRIVLSKSTLDVPVNGSQLVEASVIPLSAPQLLKWQSNSDAVATVSAVDGGAMVKGVQAGQAEIKAISPDGGVVSSFKVFVYDTN